MNTLDPAVSQHMRQMQRRSAASRWAKLTPAQRKTAMSGMAKAGWVVRKARKAKASSNAHGVLPVA